MAIVRAAEVYLAYSVYGYKCYKGYKGLYRMKNNPGV